VECARWALKASSFMLQTRAMFFQTQEWQGTARIQFNNGSYSDNDIADVITQRLTEPFNVYKKVFIPVVNTIGLAINSRTALPRTAG